MRLLVEKDAGDDLKWKFGIPFPRSTKVKLGETVVFSWIVFKSLRHRDRTKAKMMKDLASKQCAI